MSDCSWFEPVDTNEDITQGDLVRECPIVFPPSEIPEGDEPNVPAPREYHDVIVMTQACDIEQCKVDFVLVCPVTDLEEILSEYTFENKKKRINFKNSIRKGFVYHYYLLDECDLEGYDLNYSVVNLGELYLMDLSLINEIAKNQDGRLRLKPLYREELSQSFAKTFMRIGLPRTIPEFKR